MLDISAHLFQLQAASSRVPVSPPLFWLSLHRLGSRAVVTCILLHPSSPTGGRSSWWGISASQLAISALLVPLQLAPDIKNFLFPGGSDGKESACNAGDGGLIPGLGRSPGERNGNPLQYSCLETPMDRGAWRATIHGVTKELDTTERLSLHFTGPFDMDSVIWTWISWLSSSYKWRPGRLEKPVSHQRLYCVRHCVKHFYISFSQKYSEVDIISISHGRK